MPPISLIAVCLSNTGHRFVIVNGGSYSAGICDVQMQTTWSYKLTLNKALKEAKRHSRMLSLWNSFFPIKWRSAPRQVSKGWERSVSIRCGKELMMSDWQNDKAEWHWGFNAWISTSFSWFNFITAVFCTWSSFQTILTMFWAIL